MVLKANWKSWIGLCLLAASGLAVLHLSQRSQAFCEVHVHLAVPDHPFAAVTEKLTINGTQMAEDTNRLRTFKVPLTAGAHSLTIVYEFRPRVNVRAVRTRVVAVRDGAVVDVDLQSEDSQHPDQVEAAPACEVRVLLPEPAHDLFITDHLIEKLTINGTKMGDDANRTRSIKVPLKAGEESLTIVHDFAQKIYTRIIRTRVVPVRDGMAVDVDLRNEDSQQPDQIVAGQVPTPLKVADRMCKLASVGPSDVVFDIGCGDGRLVMTAVANFAARKGVGIDIDQAKIEECKRIAAERGLQDRIDFRVGDALKLQSLDDATVVLLYVGEHLNMKLRPILKKHLKPGARIVSHEFDMGDWQPDRTEKFMELNVLGKQEEIAIHLWTIR